jgi:hypothetical protein
VNTYYDTLQVSRAASSVVIKAAYRGLSQKYHPDKNPENLVQATENMRRLNEAYAVLGDEELRAKYDEALLIEEKARTKHHRSKAQRDESRAKPRPESSSHQSKHSSQDQREKEELKSRFGTQEGCGGNVTAVPVDTISSRTPQSRIATWVPPLALILIIAWYNSIRDDRPAASERTDPLPTPVLRIAESPAPAIEQVSQRETPTFIPSEASPTLLDRKALPMGDSNAHHLIPETSGTNLAWPSGHSPSAGPNCVYKGVMSDQDYRNCGISPPR